MTQDERRRFLLEFLLRERGETMALPGDEATQRRLLRALCNVREPVPAPADFLAVQDAYLQEETRRLSPIDGLMPDPTDLPKGCKFSPRCPRCMDRCRTEQPPCVTRGTHQIRCHLFGEGEV